MASDRKLLACGTPHGRLRPILGFGIVWALFPSLLCPAQKVESEGINNLIQTYATSINRADVNLAESIWSDAPEVTFIHPLGEEHGRAQIEEDVYRHLMGDTFSERKLVPKDISVHVYGDAAWSEFQWDFYAKVKKDGSAFHSQGRETQIYRREKGRWQIIHVHYSGLPVSGKLTGF